MEKNRIYLELPKICPTCRCETELVTSATNIQFLICPNPDCPEKMIGKLAHFCERDCMNIDGMSEETIKKLVEHGYIKEYADFFKLDQEPTIAYIPGFGKTSWRKMCDAAEKARTTDFVRFITALSIPNIGKGQAKTLLKYLSESYDELCNVAGYHSDSYNLCMLLFSLVDVGFDFSAIDGFGSIIASSLSNWISDHFSFNETNAETRVFALLTFTDVKPSINSNIAISSITGKSFCITGKLIRFSNRQALVDVIESHGAKWVDSVSNRTDYLINNDVTSTSGKNKKAKELNIPIISEEDFMNMIG